MNYELRINAFFMYFILHIVLYCNACREEGGYFPLKDQIMFYHYHFLLLWGTSEPIIGFI